MKMLITTLVAGFGFLGSALACSPPPSWQETGFWIVGGDAWSEDEELVITDDSRLVIRTETFDAPAFADFAPLLEITVTGPDGELAGSLAPAPLFAHAVWVPEAPFVDGARYTFTVRVEGSWREEGRTSAFVIDAQPMDPPSAQWTLAADKFEKEIHGECLSEFEDSCGSFCEERELLETQMRIQLDFALEVDETHWPGARAVRIAAGVDETEALAILDRTAFSNFVGERGLDVAAYKHWPRDQACGAVEVIDMAGVVLLREARCVDLVPDPALGAAIDARLGREGGSAQPRSPQTPDEPGEPAPASTNAGGCSATDSTTAPLWALVLLGAAMRRRR